ncbi:Serine carboxypeptidase-like 18 [Camellia lanceoleosa]|uniref:Serine carboxypeptidase-like 18 n=1 Tax=Camellia lanceoleosa TaxID=1840588 RepID=A0ACC0FQR9_9ERIC|nr:Serine carboxypeptidase-like 18 [Camellia lanceoleosa]
MIKNYDGSTSIVSHTTSDYNNLRNSKQSIKIFHQQNYINMSPMLLMLRLILVIVLSYIGLSQSIIIETLPGFPGYLPFKLETGYVGVGESDEVQLFYYFIESERSPKDDPLMLWLTGGPGCSALSGLLFEIGPFTFDYPNSSGNKPTLEVNPYSWTKVANIIFLDSPVGTGFSYANTDQAYNTNDTLGAAQAYSFLRKWLMDHPKFLINPLYIGGDSYSGLIVPIIVQEIYDGNEVTLDPPMNIQGYLLGNPFTDENYLNSRVVFAHRMALLSDDLYESTKANCHGNYVDVDPNNTLCVIDLQVVEECIENLDPAQILEPNCDDMSPKPNLLKWNRNALKEDPKDLLLSLPPLPGPWCRNYNYLYAYIWANDRTVQEALHIRQGTKKEWLRCNKSLDYTENVYSSVIYHQNLTTKHCRALIYSGDHDMLIPYVGTREWINLLNLSVIDGWKPWFVDGQVGGFREMFTKNSYILTFATVKGGGHTAPEYRPKECLAMVSRWFAHFPL